MSRANRPTTPIDSGTRFSFTLGQVAGVLTVCILPAIGLIATAVWKAGQMNTKLEIVKSKVESVEKSLERVNDQIPKFNDLASDVETLKASNTELREKVFK